jgi:alkylresorcinol/alkylpyrone synthase
VLSISARGAILAACEPLGVGPEQIDQLFFVSSTGIATPSIDARLVNRLGLRADVRRTPIFGLGCMAGAGGLARLADALRPDQLGVLLSVELCSLTLQRRDLSIPNLISSGLFGDGAAAAVVVGAEHPLAETNPLLGPEIVDARSVFYRDTEQVMGWEIGSEGFRVVLSADVPKVVERHVRSDIEAFLSSHDLELEQIASIVAHPGGPRVLEALQAALGLDDDALALSWKTLRELGNLSSASVLMVLGETMTTRRPAQGTPGLLFAMGPGFCSELLLLDW